MTALPVARVAVDVPLPHLDRLFDFSVPDELDEAAQPGVRVRVRFAGRLVDGYIVERVADSEFALQPIKNVVTNVPVLTPQVSELVTAVADRYAGTFLDVVRSAVVPRHAAVEKAVLAEPNPAPKPPPVLNAAGAARWQNYDGGAAMVSRLASGECVRAVWSAMPGSAYEDLAALVQATASSGKGAIVVVPDARDLQRVAGALSALVDSADIAVLSADVGPRARYRTFLRILLGRQQIVLGTRTSVFAPVENLGLVVVWDDGDDMHCEPHAPYWHAREVAALRSHLSGCSLVIGGFSRTAEAAQLVETGWAKSIAPKRPELKKVVPTITATGDDFDRARDPAAAAARIPHRAWVVARDGLHHGPVLISVARRGYLAAVACQNCRTPATCRHCNGPMSIAGRGQQPACRWCGKSALDWSCSSCKGTAVRAMSIGVERTAEEIGRAFPGIPVLWADGENVTPTISRDPRIVVATPGVEPIAEGGYAAVLLLDARQQLERPTLRASEDTARKWFAAASLARPHATVVVVADNALPTVQGLVRWDPVWLAGRELADRQSLALPPAVRMAALTGTLAAVNDLIAAAELPASVLRRGPVPVRRGEMRVADRDRADHIRMLLSVDRAHGLHLSRALRQATSVRSARKETELVEVRIDPVTLG